MSFFSNNNNNNNNNGGHFHNHYVVPVPANGTITSGPALVQVIADNWLEMLQQRPQEMNRIGEWPPVSIKLSSKLVPFVAPPPPMLPLATNTIPPPPEPTMAPN